jgi:hypothetical protein
MDCYNVYIAPSADRRFASHLEFLARVSENAAARLYKEYEGALGFLSEFPRACPVYTPSTAMNLELRYKLFGRRYRIVFEVSEQNVHVYDIQDCRQNFDRNLI